MRRYRIGSVFIREGADYTGIITETDLVRKAMAKGVLPAQERISTFMTSPILHLDLDRTVMDANNLMHFHGIRHLGVSHEGRIVGLLSVRDLVHYFSTATPSPTEGLSNVYQPLSILVHRDILKIGSDASLERGAQVMAGRKVGSLLVTEGGEYVGIVTETDLVRKAMGYGLDPTRIVLGTLMNTPIIDIDINRSLADANSLMASKRIRHLAVTEKKEIIGIISVRDLIGMVAVRDLPRFFAK
jgi:CBS domain-containing protein